MKKKEREREKEEGRKGKWGFISHRARREKEGENSRASLEKEEGGRG